jgi:hypothetical protein
MGKRARAARRRAQVEMGHGGRHRPDAGGADHLGDVRAALAAAVAAARHGDPDRARAAAERLASSSAGPRTVEVAIVEALRAAVGSCWARGWQPADVERVVRRRLDVAAAELAVSALADERLAYAAATVEPDWDDQLAALAAVVRWPPESTHLAWWTAARAGRTPVTAVETAVAVLALLDDLPTLPLLAPRPGSAPTGRAPVPEGAAAARDLARVRALLAKAESTQFPEEGEALAAKAQELLARHAMDRSMLDAATGEAVVAVGRRVAVDDPYAGAKVILLQQVAEANRCRSAWSAPFGFAAVYGLAVDLAAVDLLFTSLLVQADRALAGEGSKVDRSGRSRTRSFRQAFLLGFATRVGARLRAAGAAGVAAAEAAHGAALVPVLAARDASVDTTFRAAHPRLVSRSVGTSNAAGWAAGAAAGDAASLERGPAIGRR